MHLATELGGGGDGAAGRLLDAGGIEIEQNERRSWSDHFRFVTQFIDQFGDSGDLDAGLAARRLGDLDDGQARRGIDAEIGGLDDVDRSSCAPS